MIINVNIINKRVGGKHIDIRLSYIMADKK